MATGAGLGGLIMAVMPIVGVISILQARRRRKSGQGDGTPESDLEARQAAAAEMERRMASYLAGRDMGRYDPTPAEQEQEYRR